MIGGTARGNVRRPRQTRDLRRRIALTRRIARKPGLADLDCRAGRVSTALRLLIFAAGVVVSLGASWILVSRLERLGHRLGFSEALLGMLAAFAADTPEITTAVTALAGHDRRVGAGVVLLSLIHI